MEKKIVLDDVCMALAELLRQLGCVSRKEGNEAV